MNNTAVLSPPVAKSAESMTVLRQIEEILDDKAADYADQSTINNVLKNGFSLREVNNQYVLFPKAWAADVILRVRAKRGKVS
jgi:hypothetical protein